MPLKSKLLSLKDCIYNSIIYNTYYNKKIDDKIVYFESRDGLDFTGNIFRIVEELSNEEYNDLKIYVYAEKEVIPKIEKLKKNYNLNIHKIIKRDFMASVILEKAKYIFTDSSIRLKYVKRPGQIFINTWHGTPLKLMGIDNIPEEQRLADVQHPLMSSDYLLYPNDYMREKMMKAYMIDEIYSGKILFEGYPRNSVFFDADRRVTMKNKLNLSDKEVFIYMPTFKGIMMERHDDEQKKEIEEYLIELDGKLTDNQILIVKLHVYNQSKIDFSKFSHIKSFPYGYEIYDIVNMADILITDYSSVFFDFANTRRKIILFNYDEEEYMKYRGTYIPLSELPFPKVQSIEDLVYELNSKKDYDDSEFINKFCKYDRPNAVKYLCKHIFKGENVCREETIKKTKKNVLIYAGALFNNGITSSLISLLSNIDTDKTNYYITYRQWEDNIIENHEQIFKKIPNGIKHMPLRFHFNPTIFEKIAFNKYFSTKKPAKCPQILHKAFKRLVDRQYPNFPFDVVIDFDGYGKIESLMFSKVDVKNAIWVHNDMIQEIKTRSIQNFNVLNEVYNNYDDVVVVSSDLIKPTSEISGIKNNIKVVHNFNNFEKTQYKSLEGILLDENTTIFNTVSKDIKDVLKSDGNKFITIGRFSPEKGHERLLNAFDEFCNDFPNTQLIIIGGHGIIYEDTKRKVSQLKHHENVTLIKWISNPMPILKECDLFILPSFYEGWGMVLMEADTLNIPIIVMDIVGIQWIKEYNGYIVENSKKGILNGMYDFMEGKVKTLDIDYVEYNKNVIDEFYSIIED